MFCIQRIKFEAVHNVNIAINDGENVSRDEVNTKIVELYNKFNHLETFEVENMEFKAGDEVGMMVMLCLVCVFLY